MLTAASAMVETCLLLPAAATAEKRAERPQATARCLFGTADPGAAELLLREQLAAERERLLWRFGFQVAAALAEEGLRIEEAQSQPLEPAKAPRRPRPAPYHRQTTVKDFFRVQKAPAEKKLEVVSNRQSDPTCVEADVD